MLVVKVANNNIVALFTSALGDVNNVTCSMETMPHAA